MRYTGLLKLGKDSYQTTFSLLKELKITQKEAILLQQIEFNNKKSDFLDIPKTILAEITHMSRTHLYRSLQKLKNMGLLHISKEGMCVSEAYLSIKNENDKATYNKKLRKIAKNVRLLDANLESKNEDLDSIKLEQKSSIRNNEEMLRLTPQHDGGKISSQHDGEQIKNIDSNPQNVPSFFNTKESQNVTKVSQNVTHSILYNNKETFSLSLQDKEKIYFNPQKEGLKKLLNLQEQIQSFLNDLSNTNLESNHFFFSKDTQAEIAKQFQGLTSQAEKAKISNELMAKLDQKGVKSEFLEFAKSLGQSAIFLNIKAKKAFINEALKLLESNKLQNALDFSKNNQKLWITTDSDYIGRKYLKEIYQIMLKELNNEIQTQEIKARQSLNKEDLIYEMDLKHGQKIREFIAYRASKRRFFNEASLTALYATLGTYFANGKDIEAMLDQSIQRDYNWVFPLTHRSRKKHKKSA